MSETPKSNPFITAKDLLTYDTLVREQVKGALVDLTEAQAAVNNTLGLILMALVDVVGPTLDVESREKLMDALVLADLELGLAEDGRK